MSTLWLSIVAVLDRPHLHDMRPLEGANFSVTPRPMCTPRPPLPPLPVMGHRFHTALVRIPCTQPCSTKGARGPREVQPSTPPRRRGSQPPPCQTPDRCAHLRPRWLPGTATWRALEAALFTTIYHRLHKGQHVLAMPPSGDCLHTERTRKSGA